jgi:hypothetical protein
MLELGGAVVPLDDPRNQMDVPTHPAHIKVAGADKNVSWAQKGIDFNVGNAVPSCVLKLPGHTGFVPCVPKDCSG